MRIPLRARSTSPKISVFLSDASFSMPASRPSSSSDTRVIPSRPTIESAPCAWCRCDWLALSCAASALSAANARSAYWARWMAWSISPLTQESGPTSKSARAVIAPARSPASGDLEARHRTFQLFGELGKLTDRHCSALGALGGLLSDVEDVFHAGRDVVCGFRLLFGCRRDALDQLRALLRHRSDLRKRLARGVRELRALDHALGALLHGGDRVLRVRLNGLDDRADLLGCFGGALRETLHFFRNHREAAPRSEEHTSELQSHVNLVCRLLLEKKKKKNYLDLFKKKKKKIKKK